MSWIRVAASRLRGLFQQARRERELDDELRFHLDMQIEENRQAGMNPSEARYAAMRSLGAVEPVKETYRDQRAFPAIETIARDFRYALRTLGRSRGFTITSVATLALAIGANTAIFSVLNAVLFRPLPYRSPDQLTMLWTEIPSQNLREGRPAFLDVELWRQQTKSFSDLVVFDPISATLTTPAHAEHVSVARISPNVFQLLGVSPVLGRGFTTEEAQKRIRAALISHRFWQTRFGGSQQAIGSSIEIDGIPSRIIGILPPSAKLPLLDADVWEPHTLFPDWEARRVTRGGGSWLVIGRLRDGVSVEQAQTEINAIAHRLDRDLPLAGRNRGISVVPLSLQVTGPKARLALWMLFGAVFCLLLIAAANVASLSLARALSRERELAIRAALGASRARIVRQLLVESLTLAAISASLGLLLAQAGIRLIVAFAPAGLHGLDQVGLHPRVLAASLILCLLTALLAGLAPAITAARRHLQPSGHEGGRSVAGGVATRRLRRALVVTEFALAILLLAGAGLLTRSLLSVQRVQLGFHPERVLSLQFAVPAPRADFVQRLLEEVRSLPGVRGAAIISDLFASPSAERVVTPQESLPAGSPRLRLRSDEVSPGFFETVQAPLRSGRFFSAADGASSPLAAIVNEAMARRLWPGRDATGKRFKLGAADSPAPWFTVVGVVGDMRRQGLETEPAPQMFEPLAQNPPRLATLLVRTSLDDPLQMMGPIQQTVHRLEKQVPLYGVTTLENQLARFLAQRRFQASLLIAFSAAALLMAAIGIYGLLQYSIATRTHEIGIRLAIGAQASEIFRIVIGEGLKLSLTGLALGLVATLIVGRAASSLLFGVTSSDPLTFVSASLLLTAIAAAACYFPARRAMKIEPVIALRQQ